METGKSRTTVRWWVPLAAIALGWILTMCPAAAQDFGSKWKDTIVATVTVQARVLFSKGILATLDSLASAGFVEHIRCGLGRIIGAEAYVDVLYAPKLAYATSIKVQADEPCPISTILDWHNHPFDNASTPAVEQCYLSRTDIRSSAYFSSLLVMVHVRKGVYCWWSQDQVTAAFAADKNFLWPVKGQTSW